MTVQLELKRDRLLAIPASYERVAVAFSAGVDSTVVAQAAMLALGPNASAITAVSPSLASGELEQARELAKRIGIEHRVIHTDEFSRPGYQQNAGDRCYYCKSELYEHVEQILSHTDGAVVCNGANLDDLGDHRPGMLAAREHGVRSPLIEAGFTKADVRDLARYWQLPVWDKPASPCLSSRIAYGVEVTAERVQRIDAAESLLRATLQVRNLRVRLEANELARIELPFEAIATLASDRHRQQIVDGLKSLGFRYITLDLEGFRSGSLNAALPIVELHSGAGSP